MLRKSRTLCRGTKSSNPSPSSRESDELSVPERQTISELWALGTSELAAGCRRDRDRPLSARTGASKQQSGREFASFCTATRAQDAAVQIGSICPALPQHACRHSQYLQSSAPSRLAINAADFSSRSGERMGMAMADTPVTPASISPSIRTSTAMTIKNATTGLRRMSAAITEVTVQYRIQFIQLTGVRTG
jgi:hypothetical protein